MSIGAAIGQYLIAGALFSVLDVLWLGLLAKEFYRRQFPDPLTERASRVTTIAFYALLIAVLVWRVTGPSIADGNFGLAVLGGAFSGLIAFAVWAIYNVKTHHYPQQVVLVEALWGAVACAVVCGGTFRIWSWFG